MNKEAILTKIAALETALAELRREVERNAPEDNDQYAGFRYPPCDLSNAEPGDKVELWNGEIGEVYSFSPGAYPVQVEFCSRFRKFTQDGMYHMEFPDDNLNVKCLIKKTPTA